MSWHRLALALTLALAAGSVASQWMLQAAAKQKDVQHSTGAAARDDAASAAAFEAIVPVLRHRRCMNCHSSGEFPRQGDDGHRHTMNVRRGLDGEGVAGLKCSTCHQDHNLQGEHMPPGAPDWHLPTAGEPMIWEGLNDRQLCELFKNPAANGHRSVDEIVEHMNTPLVLWGWHPGEGRTPVPTPQAEFLAKVKEWASHGAACPVEGSSSQPANSPH
ncbi:MAG TPA: hypothetical protein VH024_01780 [Candidatus Angelobacter sp.]|jgi:hypothetical protein|nr:hypothetical protein [Candidatus Angelobacter sp.]